MTDKGRLRLRENCESKKRVRIQYLLRPGYVRYVQPFSPRSPPSPKVMAHRIQYPRILLHGGWLVGSRRVGECDAEREKKPPKKC